MKRLFLLRHAKSSWGDPTLADFDRPLNERGQDAGAAMGRYLKKENIHPDLILVSTAKRAQETFDLVAPAFEDIPVIHDKRLYVFDAQAVIKRLTETDASVDSVLVVGHNPAMHELVMALADRTEGKNLELLNKAFSKYPTCTMAGLSCKRKDWKKMEKGAWSLDLFVRPKDLKS